jgi:hypothetical protein
MTLLRATYLAVHRKGIKVVLDGVGGDSLLNGGNRMPALLRSGRNRCAAAFADGWARNGRPGASRSRIGSSAPRVALPPRATLDRGGRAATGHGAYSSTRRNRGTGCLRHSTRRGPITVARQPPGPALAAERWLASHGIPTALFLGAPK